MVTSNWVSIGLCNGLLPGGTKPLPEPNVDLSSLRSSHIYHRAISQDIPLSSNIQISLKVWNLKCYSNLAGVNLLGLCPISMWWNELWKSPKWKYLQFDEITITGCIGSCQNDNIQCSQWLKFHQNDNIFVSVMTRILIKSNSAYKQLLKMTPWEHHNPK